MMVEILDDAGHAVGPGEMGRTVVTTLENQLMPLVRYEIGDYMVASRSPCRCGRTLPTFERVIGRGLNLFRLANGRLLSPWAFVEGAARQAASSGSSRSSRKRWIATR